MVQNNKLIPTNIRFADERSSMIMRVKSDLEKLSSFVDNESGGLVLSYPLLPLHPNPNTVL
jgi:hypothetical protein